MHHQNHHHPFSSPPTKTTTMPSSSTTTKPKPPKPQLNTNTNTNNHHHHSAYTTATLDLLILILVLLSTTFLITSYLSYLFNSLTLLLPHLPSPPPAAFYLSLYLSLSLVSLFSLRSLLFRPRRRRCSNPRCSALSNALEFDLQLHSQENLTTSSTTSNGVDVEKLPWKGGTEGNPDYECLRAELRKMAPVNGRAVLLFRAKCGCPVAKLVGWGPKKGRKHKKALANTAANGDHR